MKTDVIEDPLDKFGRCWLVKRKWGRYYISLPEGGEAKFEWFWEVNAFLAKVMKDKDVFAYN